jgi:tetratricopeptide (TPR) repeat protein
MTRRFLVILILLLLLLVSAALGWHGWRRYSAPMPPEIEATDVAPALAEALATARRTVQQEPYSAAAWGELGKLLRECGLVEKAATCFAQAEQLDPKSPLWPYLQGEALLLHDPDAALPHLRRAVSLCDRVDPDNLAPRLRLAELLLTQGAYEEAEVQLHRALEIEPDNPNVHLNLGLLAYARDDLETSRRHLLRSRHSPFTQQKANAQLAVVCRRLGDAPAAADYSLQARTLPHDISWPDPFRALSSRTLLGKQARLEYLDRLHTQKRHAEAVQLLRDMQAEQGPDYQISVALGQNLAELGQVSEALDALGEAIRLSPESVMAHYYRSKVFWALAEQAGRPGGDPDRARELYRSAAADAQKAIDYKADHAQAHLMLGLCLEHLGHHPEALTALRRAVQCAPDFCDPALHLGEALAKGGQPTEARVYLERALQLARPDDPRPRAALKRLNGTP